jgi:hypothetical protein
MIAEISALPLSSETSSNGNCYNAKARMKKLELNTYPSDFSRMPEFFEKFNTGKADKADVRGW